MKLCPTCGARCAEEDAFCEADGTRLSPPAEGERAATPPPAAVAHGPAAKPSGGACAACGAGEADDGDGYCSSCGHKMPTARSEAETLPGTIDQMPVLGPWGAEGYRVAHHGEQLCLLLGSQADLALERQALEALSAQPGLPRSRGSGRDRERGAYLLLEFPSGTTQPLSGEGRPKTVAGALSMVRGLLALAEALEAAGFSFEPSPLDFLAEGEGLALARLRGARRLEADERLDARALCQALGPSLLPLPAAAGPTELVRLLVPSRDSVDEGPSSVEEVRAILRRVEAEGASLREAKAGGPSAQLCDRGLWRPYNQDATAIATGEASGERWAVLVVCDGVSSSRHSERAASVAAKTARDALAHFARSGDIAHEASAAAVATAIRAAHTAVCADRIGEGDESPPGTTIVAALLYRRRLTVGWVGDSRAYWITPRGAEQLTRDHSYVNELIARGEMTEEEALRSPDAHTITRCLGPLEVGDTLAEAEPDVRGRDLAGPGVLVLCSDGLWNYAPSAADIASLVQAAGFRAGAEATARFLVNVALARGGHDNVSVAVYTHS